jgi:hypothetical protein
VILAYTLVAASGSAFGMVTVVSQVTNTRVEFDVAGATDSESDADSEADVAAETWGHVTQLLVHKQPPAAWDVVNDVILDWCAAAVDDRSASIINPENDQRKMRPSTALTLNDTLKETATLSQDTRGKQFFFPGYDPTDTTTPGHTSPQAAPATTGSASMICSWLRTITSRQDLISRTCNT